MTLWDSYAVPFPIRWVLLSRVDRYAVPVADPFGIAIERRPLRGPGPNPSALLSRGDRYEGVKKLERTEMIRNGYYLISVFE